MRTPVWLVTGIVMVLLGPVLAAQEVQVDISAEEPFYGQDVLTFLNGVKWVRPEVESDENTQEFGLHQSASEGALA